MPKKKGKKKKERSSAPRLGAQYQAVTMGVKIFGPPVQAAIMQKDAMAALDRFKSRAYQKGVVVSLIDQWGSKKLGHAAALSRKSVTALAPEFYATVGSAIEADMDPNNTYAAFQQATTGYEPNFDAFSLATRPKTYFPLKYGLGIGRKIVNKTRIAEPIKKALSMVGGSL